MGTAMRRAIHRRNLNIEVLARSEAEIENYIDEIDVIMVGPHLSVWYEDLQERYGNTCMAILMRGDYYASLDGEAALDHLLAETGWK